MKKSTEFKRPLFQATLVAIALFAAVSCSNNKQAEDSKDIAEERNDAKFENTRAEKDAQFLVNGSEINLEEIRLGQLAQQNCKANEVKELGRMMEEGHAKSLKNLVVLANRKLISVPASPTRKAMGIYKDLSNKSGDEFDREYCNMMVEGHKDAILVFEKAAVECSDPDVRALAISSLPNLKRHLEHAIDCQRKCDRNELAKVVSIKN